MEHVVSKVSIVVKDIKYTYQPHFMDLTTALQKFGGAIRLSPESGNLIQSGMSVTILPREEEIA